MFFRHDLFHVAACAVVLAITSLPGLVFAQADTSSPVATPWGISASASSFKNHTEWFPKMSAAGITTVRLFPEWRGFETQRGTWKFDDGDLLLKSAAANKLEINAVLMGSPPGTKAIHAFPMENLDDWANYTTTVVKRYQKQIRYWEVWNEGNGGFNDGKHTTADYAKMAATTYAAAKAADPQAQVGLTVASFDPAYLQQTILAQAKLGKPNSFDYVCIHPYEIADGLAHPDGEIPFLWMTKLTRDVLKKSSPAKANAEIWITEVGRKLDNKPGHAVNEVTAAKDFAKIYTMSIAQGISRVQWFEAQDPAGEEAGFGLLARDGKARPAYETLKRLTAQLGPHPKYLGWVTLGRASAGYGFLLQGKTEPVLVAWMPVGMTLKDALPTTQGTNVVTGEPATELGDVPVMFAKVPPQMIATAQGNVGKNFPWGGDFSAAKTVSIHLGRPNGNDGIFQTGHANCPSVTFPDGSTGILVQGDITHPVSFFVHPSFASIHTQEYFVRATVRRVSAGNVGMNLLYEIADSQGRGAYANVGQWFGAKADDGWQTYTWQLKNACFAKMWGHDFTLRPEQSVPFVIGKVEVSTEAFK